MYHSKNTADKIRKQYNISTEYRFVPTGKNNKETVLGTSTIREG